MYAKSTDCLRAKEILILTVQGFKLSFTHREVLKLQPAHHGASRAAPSSARAMTHIFADIDKAALSLPLGCEA
ncbi:hypothetical protein WJX77_004096 [Trebouxia sp. C0004]